MRLKQPAAIWARRSWPTQRSIWEPPYVLGGNGPNQFDCSGFTKYVYSHFGYTLNRTATDQLQNGVSVSKDELQPG